MDPRLQAPLRQLTRTKAPRVINKCPFGCQLPDLDEHGYCHHLVGFIDAREDGRYTGKIMELRETIPESIVEPGENGWVPGGGVERTGVKAQHINEKVDHVVQIGYTARIYRESANIRPRKHERRPALPAMGDQDVGLIPVANKEVLAAAEDE